MAGHLIHIGYSKAGSTSLQEWFRRHPQLCFSNGGLGSFYNVYEIAQRATQKSETKIAYYVTSFEGLSAPSKSAGSLPIEYGIKNYVVPTPISISQAKVCEILKSLYHTSKILITTRGFKELFVSSYSQYARTGGVNNFSEMCAMPKKHTERATISPEEVAKHFDFNSLIKLYSEAFGEQNVIVMPFELLRDDENRFLSIIEERLGLEHFEISVGRINPSLSPEELYWYPKISSIVSRVARKFGDKNFAKIYAWYVKRAFENKLQLLIKLLARLSPDRKVTEKDFPMEFLDQFKNFATNLKQDPLYKPYLKQYLLDD